MPLKETATITVLSPNALIMNALYIPFVYFLNKFGDLVVVLIFFMFLDFITGFMKSRKICTPINRYKFEIGLYTKFFTLLFIFSFSLVVKATGYKDIDALIGVLLTLFIVAEFYSILGNGYTLRTGKILQDKDFFSFALLAIRSKAEEEISKKIDKKGKDNGKI